MQKIKYAFIGNGAFTKFLIEQVQKIPEVEVVAICARDEEKLKKTTEEFHIPKYYTDYAEMLADKEINIIHITTPPYFHFPNALEALKANKNVILEKPASMNMQELTELNNYLKTTNLKLCVNHLMRYNKIYQTVKELLESGIVGKISRIDLNNLASDNVLHADHWFWNKEQSGGIFIEHAVHFFDIYNSILGKAKILYSKTYTREQNPNIEDRAYSLFEYPNNTFASFFHSFDKPSIQESTKTNIYFENGELNINGWNAHELTGNMMIEKVNLEKFQKIVGVENTKIIKEQDLQNKEIAIKGNKLSDPVLVEISYKYCDSVHDVYINNQIMLIKNFINCIEKNLQPITNLDKVALSIQMGEESANFKL